MQSLQLARDAVERLTHPLVQVTGFLQDVDIKPHTRLQRHILAIGLDGLLLEPYRNRKYWFARRCVRQGKADLLGAGD